MLRIFIFIETLLFFSAASAQFPWPITPFHSSHEITGTFCEFRDTGSADHFHNGTDIPKPDGSPVYPVKDGVVTTIGSVTSQGSNAYVRVQDMAYVHIKPNPALSVGDSVYASRTVIGTIFPGMGHVHFTNGYVGNERNSMREADGLKPLNDPWAPIIRYVRFYQNRTSNLFPSNRVSGQVDIVVKVDEQNGPPSTYLSRRNNGIYKIGYKILSADSSSVVYQPGSRDFRFRFDSKPSNSYVHNVFFDRLSSTTSHVYIVTNDVNRDNFWDTSTLPVGNYVVMVYAQDTRNNSDTLYVPVQVTEGDLIPPEEPTLKYVRTADGRMQIGWYKNPEEDLAGYRLYYRFDNTQWKKRLDEQFLSAASMDTSFPAGLTRDIYFRLSALDNAPVPNEGAASDAYGTKKGADDRKLLIVDGFDRIESSGSWHQPAHSFAMIHGLAIAANGYGFDTAANEAVVQGVVQLENYDAVFWLLGDESTLDESFSAAEQAVVKAYLEGGGRLFVSGSEIAWDLDTDNSSGGSTAADEAFLHNYLKADYVKDDADILSVRGVPGSIFDGLDFDYGTSPYPEDYPDVIKPFGQGAIACLQYNDTMIAGIQYQGVFGNGAKAGKLVYLSFPFETITGEENRNSVMARVLDFFFSATFVQEAGAREDNALPARFALVGNYPNPFNPQTRIRFQVPVRSLLRLDIYNTLGQKVRTLTHSVYEPGVHDILWDGHDDDSRPVASGVYLLRMTALPSANGSEKFSQTRQITLMR